MIADTQQLKIAESYLDEMLAAEEAVDYDAFVRRFETRDIEHFGASRFKKDMYAIREDYGDYRSREYLGCLAGKHDPDRPDRHPGCIRYVWRGVFEKSETLIVVGLFTRDGTAYVNEYMYR